MGVDKLGVALVAFKIAREYETVVENPLLVPLVALGAGVNILDTYLARKYATTMPHVVWHLSAAALANVFLSYVG